MRKIKLFVPFIQRLLKTSNFASLVVNLGRKGAGFILLGVVTLFSLEKTLSYYFFTDDFAFLYYLGHNLDFGWPYTYVLYLFRPVYNLFGTDPFLYLLLAIVTYFL